MEKLRNHPYLLISSITCLICGMWLFVINPYLVIAYLHMAIGGGLIGLGIYKIVKSERTLDKTNLYNGIIYLGVGIPFFFFDNLIVTIILGLGFVAYPLYKIFNSSYKLAVFKRELPKLIIGLLIALSASLIANFTVKFLGAILILIAIYLFLCIFYDRISFINLFFNGTSRYYHERYQEQDDDNIIDIDYEERD